MPRRPARPRSAEKFRPFREILLRWFDAHARPLPWRADRDPYRIWVSEVMLQQTTAAAVGPKFRRFVERFPSLEALASAEEAEVLAAWQGLGYYRRARHLHAAARRLWSEFGTTWPVSVEVWAGLPGVGRYMLGAIMSQAFGRRLPVVDANVRRVLCRWFGQEGPADSGPVVAWMWETAARVVPADRPGDFNQALMELGATVCSARTPDCANCPVNTGCAAFSDGTQERLPVLAKRTVTSELREVAALITRPGEVWLVRRGDKGRWAGFWEPPRLTLHEGESEEAAKVRLLSLLGRAEMTPLGAGGTVRYGVTRYNVVLRVERFSWSAGELSWPGHEGAGWFAPAAVAEMPVASPVRRVLGLDAGAAPTLFDGVEP